MTAPKPKIGEKKGRTPTRAYAKKLWFESGKPSFRDLEALLKAAGYDVDDGNLSRWAHADAEWAAALADKKGHMEPTKLLKAIKNAKSDAKEITAEVYIGVKAQLVARLYEAIKDMPINSVDEWMKALDACDRIEALIHAERGKAVAAGDKIATPRGASPSLLARVNPPVSIAPFKKLNGNGAS